ncbi:2-amino-4-hydroxy-6-hydroxymethyldihydropteridine diphosphokinase [Salsuginibacillus halophilus]|uniref:2-amino-4-hydroxy-6-hydroxymethyldihydropteridine diphosphokinase n=1 Tax=Salsuginibacillus halophilus TaxID=517424 RepID=A0A2P8H7V8_9BACI|nr:2-amino-4-hydroxy-6-hydroxymethyldihydropteridine diphosphokinase [Salsuginibacillus halophilus]PSL42281.1 2-amino-4-hydroxy-6-hydroxymethyldihydropteridine diphosphokinase [Salsuginibacillus halophilus]
MMDNEVFIALGSNIGNREHYLEEALRLLTLDEGLSLTGTSSVYETAPVGLVDQPPFLNMAASLTTTYTSEEVLKTTQRIEQQLDRTHEKRWGPRTIDLDILMYNQENIQRSHLSIPHPRLTERAFVLVPLVEVAAAVKVPGAGKTVAELLSCLGEDEKEGVRLWKKLNGPAGFGRFES